jgi:predicted nuclease of predicted toxin-antitoxin system
MRFKIDENMPAAAVTLLRARGHDAETVIDEGLCGAEDREVATLCRTEERVLLTFDLDFADIRAYLPRAYTGIIVLRLKRQDAANTVSVLRSALDLLEHEFAPGHLWIVEKDRIRIL